MKNSEAPTQVLPIAREKCAVIRGTSCSARRNCRHDLHIALIVCGTMIIIAAVCSLGMLGRLGMFL